MGLYLLNFIPMKKYMFTFGAGVVAGVLLGLFMQEQDKKIIKESILKQVNHIRRQYIDLISKGKDIEKKN